MNDTTDYVKTVYIFKNKIRADLRSELKELLTGFGWYNLRIFGTAPFAYTIKVAHGDGLLGWKPCIPVVLSASEEAHINIALGLDEFILLCEPFVKGGVNKIIKDYNDRIDKEIEDELNT